MEYNKEFRKVVKEKFKVDVRKNYLPDQTYINLLIASLNKVEANSYNQSHIGFISEYKYLKGAGVLQPIKEYVTGCLNQLLWINSILESGKLARTEEDLEEEFDYKTPTMLGDSWTLNLVTKKGVFFRGAEPFQDSRVIINSENITEIAIALSTIAQQYGEYLSTQKNEQAKSIVIPNESSLFTSKKLEIKCLKVLKELKYPILDIDGKFLNEHGMKGAIVIWFDKCSSLSFTLKASRNRVEVAKAVMKIIPNLEIEGSSFDKTPKAIKYKKDIEQKLSQLSHK